MINDVMTLNVQLFINLENSTLQTVAGELLRNISLSILCVIIVTFIIVANFPIAILIMLW